MLSLDVQELYISPAIPGFLFCTCPENYILSASRDFAELLTLNAKTIVNQHASTLFSRTTCATMIRNNNAAILSNTSLCFQEQWVLQNGQTLFFDCLRQPYFDKHGKLVAVMVNATKIQSDLVTLRKQNETTELYLKNVIANLADHVFWEDRQGKILGCNEQQAINVGFNTPEELVGKTLDDIAERLHWEPELVERLQNNDKEVMEKCVELNIEEEVIWADGIPRTFLSKKAPLKDKQGHCIGMIGLAFDITERKQMETTLRIAKEQAESANFAKSNFIANISHDLRTPLHTMLGIAELLQIKQHYPEQEELIEGIIQSGRSLLGLVEQILQYSELETCITDTPMENIDLRQLIENLTLEFSNKANKKNVDLIISYCESTPRLIKSNPQYLRRILSNLIGNSIKFTHKGYILIAVEPVEIFKDYAILQIIVEDTGEGIAEKDLQHVFERFYRADPSYTGKHKGSGLGLAIAKQLSERLDGTLSVNSQLGMGTTFSCTLRFKLANQTIDYRDLEQQLSNANILIIDDHAKRRETLLKQIPCKNKLALTSTKAVNLYLAQGQCPEYNLIIIDDAIEAMPLYSLGNLIRKRSPERKQPMLVQITEHRNNQIVGSTSQCFQQQLSKPIQPTEISHRLTPTWQKWQESQQRKFHQPIGKNLHVLIVEDDLLIQKFTQATLTEFGCKVEIAASGQEALEKSSQKYDLIFMDIGLPDFDGIHITQKIRDSANCNFKTPIVALTAHVSDEDKKRCLNAGVNDFLTKPASYSMFKALLLKY